MKNDNVTIKELREQTGLEWDELATIVGRPVEDVKKATSKKVPTTWTTALRDAGIEIPRAGELGPEPVEPGGREGERSPRPGPGDRVETPPLAQVLDYGLLADHIEGVYRIAGHSVGATDPLLGGIISENAEKAGVAWARWVESEPKVQALVRRLMIGTPLGEVIGVHVTIVFGYVLARSVERERLAQTPPPPGADGVGAPAGDPLGATP